MSRTLTGQCDFCKQTFTLSQLQETGCCPYCGSNRWSWGYQSDEVKHPSKPLNRAQHDCSSRNDLDTYDSMAYNLAITKFKNRKECLR